MELSRDAYKAFEDIVGSQYVTQEPAICETYNQVWGNKYFYDQKFSPRPSAIILPVSTEEIQRIVKICNRYRIPFKPISSGWETVMALVTDYGIILDLRRMNRILDIDIRNMHAIVEPYVSVYRLQVEAAKYGLITGNVGAGPSAGVVATSSAHFGLGETNVSTGGPGRNLLGVEWVLPTGDILRLGAAGTGGWFSADGPGPSLRGILRGRAGANGGHGVITKAGVKLYPWYGPAEWEQVKETGAPPVHRHIEKVPEGYKIIIFKFANPDNIANAHREAAQAEILFFIGHAKGLHALPPEGTDEEITENMQANPEQMQSFMSSAAFALQASSPREMAYREKCLIKICQKHGGKVSEVKDPQYLARIFCDTIFNFDNPAVFRRFPEFMISPIIETTSDFAVNTSKITFDLSKPYRESGTLFILAGGAPMLHENYATGAHEESIINYNAYDPEAFKAAKIFLAETYNAAGKYRRTGVPGIGGPFQLEAIQHIHQNWGPVYDNYDIWLRKIKGMLDPNNVADWSGYIPAVYPAEEVKLKEDK